MHKLCFFLLLFIAKISFGQIEITWKTLEDVDIRGSAEDFRILLKSK